MTREQLNQIRVDLNERLHHCEASSEESHRLAPNSYGAGYDRGFVDGITEALLKLVRRGGLTDRDVMESSWRRVLYAALLDQEKADRVFELATINGLFDPYAIDTPDQISPSYGRSQEL